MKSPLLLALAIYSAQALSAKEGYFPEESFEAEEQNDGCWVGGFCDWWSDQPFELYRNKKNPWIEQIEISGRFHYQFGRVEGEDVRGNDFDADFVEFRRARVSAEIDFLSYFEVEVGVNLVDDRRHRAPAGNTLDWGYDSYDSIVLSFDIGDAIGKGPFDDIKLSYGRMKLKISEEVRTSSNDLLTIERSALSDRLGGDESRPTGVLLELEKGDWTGAFGAFSNETGSASLAGFGDGLFYYGSLEWEPKKRWTLRLDHAHADRNEANLALGYQHATSLAVIYDGKRWGLTTDLIYGTNSQDEARNPLREGDFYGGVVMPWLWIAKDRLQLVGRYQYARAEESEGFRLQNRYIRGQHLPPTTDLDGGFGDENHSFYLGLNWLLCEESIRIMSGISHDLISARSGEISATTYLFAIRTSF